MTGGSATDNVITGNYVGPDTAGTVGLSGGTAIVVDAGADQTTIGGTAPGTGNVVSGNFQSAIVIGNVFGTDVEGNLIGPDATDSTVLGNDIGVELDGGATGSTIGSVGAGANVIVGSADVGVLANGGTGNTVDGNFIGTDLSGTPFASLTNSEGVRILFGTGNTFSNNRISSSKSPIPSDPQHGVEVDAGPNTFTGNTIDHNTDAGIAVLAGTGVTISQNSIDLNGGLGIDLGNTGVTDNDVQPDADTGPNNLQNFPVNLVGTIAGSTLHVTGDLPSAIGAGYTVEFFASPAANPSGHGEGAQYLGSTHVNTDGNGHGTIDALLSPAQMPEAGAWLSATATASDGSTSEFAQSVQLTDGPGTTISIAPEADTMVDAAQAEPELRRGRLLRRLRRLEPSALRGGGRNLVHADAVRSLVDSRGCDDRQRTARDDDPCRLRAGR